MSSTDEHGDPHVFMRAGAVDDQSRLRLALSRLSAGVSMAVAVSPCPAPDCWKRPGELHWHVTEGLVAYPADDALLAVCPGDHGECPITDPDHVCVATPF